MHRRRDEEICKRREGMDESKNGREQREGEDKGVEGERWKQRTRREKYEEMEMGDGSVLYRLAFNKTLQHDVIVREQLHLYVQYHSVNMDHSTAVAVPRTALTCLTFQHPCFLSSLSSPPLLFSAFSDLNRFLAS